MILQPTDSAVCGISLNSFTQAILAFDTMYFFLGLGAVAGSFYLAITPINQVESVLNLLLIATVGLGATLGMVGLNRHSPENLNQYVLTRFVRIGVSLFITALALSHVTETATTQVDEAITETKSDVSEEQRQAMIRQFSAALTAGLVAWELVSDAASFYCAYVVGSLGEMMRMGGVTPAQVAAPLLAGV
jgi:hypothetical protein